MRLWRLQRRAFPPLDGEGARRHGGRWNSRGRAVVYCSTHLSLAALELLVHTDPDLLPMDLAAFTLEVPDSLEIAVPLAARVDLLTASVVDARHVGDAWLAAPGHAPLLRVPSIVVPDEDNILLDPLHPDAARVVVASAAPFQFDRRLL